MAAHKVKCFYCNEIFDANITPFVKPRANRYAHKDCYEKAQAGKSQEEKDYEALVVYIKQLLGEHLNPRVWKQLKEYKDQYGFTYSGIHKTLIWFYELKHNDIDKANGAIGIVPYVYKDACDYYYALYLAQIANEDKDVEHFKVKVREFTIENPRAQKRLPRLFKLDEEENNEQE